MTNAADRGWGDPDSPNYRDNIVGVTAGGVTVWLHRQVADVFRYLNTMLARTYNLAGYADDWGYCNRDIRGHPGVKSNHAWGLAEDGDASVNPMTTDLAAHHEFVRQVIDPILAPFGGRLVWGGEYASPRKDYMHFEYVGTPKQAIADSATARRLLAALTPEDDTVTPEDRVAIATLAAQQVLDKLLHGGPGGTALVATHEDMKTLLRGTSDGKHPANLTTIAAAVGVKQ